jgi:hypothetical protein
MINLYYLEEVKAHDNQMVDEGKFIIIEILELINEQRLLELDYNYFVSPNEIVSLGSDHHWWKMLQKD